MNNSSGGDKDKPPDKTILNQHNGHPKETLSTTSAWASGGNGGSEVRMRSFAEIISEEKQQRNILEIHLVKKTVTDNIEGESQRARALTFDDLGELIFDSLSLTFFRTLEIPRR